MKHTDITNTLITLNFTCMSLSTGPGNGSEKNPHSLHSVASWTVKIHPTLLPAPPLQCSCKSSFSHLRRGLAAAATSERKWMTVVAAVSPQPQWRGDSCLWWQWSRWREWEEGKWLPGSDFELDLGMWLTGTLRCSMDQQKTSVVP